MAAAEAALGLHTTEGLAELRTELEGSLEAVRAEQTAASEEASRLADERVGAVAGDAKLAQEAGEGKIRFLDAMLDEERAAFTRHVCNKHLGVSQSRAPRYSL